MARVAVVVRQAHDVPSVPLRQATEQAHRPAVRNERGDAVAVQQRHRAALLVVETLAGETLAFKMSVVKTLAHVTSICIASVGR